MKIILEKCKFEQIETLKWIKKLGTPFLNAQQMSIQQVVHISLFIPLYHAIRSFQFINICEQQHKNICVITTKNITTIISKFYKNLLQIIG